MRSSKILRNTAILVGILILMIFVTAGLLTSSSTSKAEDGFYVHDFDSQIADTKIVNGEKEYFAVKVQRGKYDSYYNVYDRQLNPLLEKHYKPE